jgi:hypothetical protein
MALVQGWAATSLLPGAAEAEILAAEPELMGVLINAYVVVLSLLISRYLVARALTLRPVIDRVAGGSLSEGQLYRGVGGWLGPTALAVAITMIEAAAIFSATGPFESAILLPILMIVHLPLATGTWIVITVLSSLDRLGRTPLDLDHHSAGSTLGLKPVGELAVATFAYFAAGSLPVLLANTNSSLALGINTTIFLAAVVVFFLSMYRIHLQMSRAKEGAIAEARQSWEAAYRLGLNQAGSNAEQRAALLTAADVLDRRAHAIKSWPLTGGLYGQVYGIIIGVLAGLLTRVIAVSVGV